MQGKLERKCIGCGELKPRQDMIKITKDFQSGELVLNPNSLTFGRSAYLCYNQSCIGTALKKNKLNKVLKTNKTIEKSELLALIETQKLTNK